MKTDIFFFNKSAPLEILPKGISPTFIQLSSKIEEREAVEASLISYLKDNLKDLTIFPGTPESMEIGIKASEALGVKCLTDVLSFEEGKTLTARRKIYGAHLDGLYKIGKEPVIIICSKAVKETPIAQIEQIYGSKSFGKLNIKSNDVNDSYKVIETVKKLDSDDLEKKDLIFIGGRGLKNKDNFEKMAKLAISLGGTYGCTRAAAIAGWCDYNRVIGLSGVSIKPKVCVTFGVSGAAPFLFGIQGAEKVIAVNKDVDAPIFQRADYGICKDCNQIIQGLEKGE